MQQRVNNVTRGFATLLQFKTPKMFSLATLLPHPPPLIKSFSHKKKFLSNVKFGEVVSCPKLILMASQLDLETGLETNGVEISFSSFF